jgi:hypothetical protein
MLFYAPRTTPCSSSVTSGIPIGTNTMDNNAGINLTPKDFLPLKCTRCASYREAAMDAIHLMHHLYGKVDQQAVESEQ